MARLQTIRSRLPRDSCIFHSNRRGRANQSPLLSEPTNIRFRIQLANTHAQTSALKEFNPNSIDLDPDQATTESHTCLTT